MCSLYLIFLVPKVRSGLGLREISFYFAALSFVLLISVILAPPLREGIKWSLQHLLPARFLPLTWRESIVLSMPLRDDSKLSSEWLRDWKEKWRGRTPVLSTIRILPWFGLMLIFTLVLPAAQKVENNTTTVTHICLPHVEAETDQYHWTMDSFCKGDPALFTDTVFCESGFEPPWQEGQTIKWYRFRREPTCQVLLGYEGQRDKNHNIVNW